MDVCWDQTRGLPQVAPADLRHLLPERWVRFHSLPEGKRYADTSEEAAEILRRQRALLDELRQSTPLSDLIVIAEDWSWHNVYGGGWSRTAFPNAWPWRATRSDYILCKDKCDDCRNEPPEYLWVNTGLSEAILEGLLLDVSAEGATTIAICAPDLTWLFCPYDGGVDIYMSTEAKRDALKGRHPAWLSDRPDGL